MDDKKRVLIANITWNNSGWRNIYINPKAGHAYARKLPGHESLNFEFNKNGLDDEEHVHGFIQWTVTPAKISPQNAIIIFYSNNLQTHEGEIVGVYGDAKILDPSKRTKWNGFENNELLSNLVAKKEYSLLFPVPLKSDKYSGGTRLVPQVGYTYKETEFAERIILDEIKELQKAGIKLDEYNKLKKIYTFVTNKDYSEAEMESYNDEKEQEDLLQIVKTNQREQIIKDLGSINPQTPELVEFRGKQYKRDNKSIIELKILRDFKCQLCEVTIMKKDNTHYIEAAHITEKRHKGPETPDNLLILCPNHHKEFDLGSKKIIERTKEKIVFELNGVNYTVSLELK